MMQLDNSRWLLKRLHTCDELYGATEQLEAQSEHMQTFRAALKQMTDTSPPAVW